MKFLEKDLEEIIFTADKKKLKERGLIVSGKVARQLKIGNYGIADLVTVDRVQVDWREEFQYGVTSNARKTEITIYELKKDKISVSSFMQVMTYAKGVHHYLSKNREQNVRRQMEIPISIRIVLVGSTIDLNSSIVYLPELISGLDFKLSLYTYDYDLEGIKFTQHYNYNLLNPGI